jgi:hypothetical protein
VAAAPARRRRKTSPSLLQKPVDTTKQALQGGEFHDRIATGDNYFLYDSNFNTSGNPRSFGARSGVGQGSGINTSSATSLLHPRRSSPAYALT